MGVLYGAFQKAGYQTLFQEDLCWYDIWGSLLTNNQKRAVPSGDAEFKSRLVFLTCLTLKSVGEDAYTYSMQGRWGEEGYTKKWHVCWGGGNVKKCTSKSVFQPSETIMWNLSKACVLCQNVFHALWNISGKFSVKVGGKIMWGWPTSPFLMLITACTCRNIQYVGTC